MDRSTHTKYIIAAIAFIIITVAIYFLFIFQKSPPKTKSQETSGEVRELADLTISDRPYVTLTPTTDGAEIIISIENMSKFDRIEYELTYLADNPQIVGDKLTRGATGTDINTKDPKYKKSILLGTASRGVRSPDTGIADGKLTMHMFVAEEEFLSETEWTLEKIGTSPITIADKSANFQLEMPTLGKSYWVIIADTVGVPSNPPDFKVADVILPVYGTFSIAPPFSRGGTLSLKVGSDLSSPQLYTYNHQDGTWQKLTAVYNSSSGIINADVSNFATFVVVFSQ